MIRRELCVINDDVNSSKFFRTKYRVTHGFHYKNSFFSDIKAEKIKCTKVTIIFFAFMYYLQKDQSIYTFLFFRGGININTSYKLFILFVLRSTQIQTVWMRPSKDRSVKFIINIVIIKITKLCFRNLKCLEFQRHSLAPCFKKLLRVLTH